MTLSKQVLIIEDNSALLENLKEILELGNYQTYIAENAYEGLELLHTLKPLPILIIIDLLMPKMNGTEFYQQVRARPEWGHIPFVFLSGSREQLEAVEMSPEYPGVTCLLKPFDFQKLLQVVAQVLS